MTCTSCRTVGDSGSKYCVVCGSLLPLDEDSAPYFASLFRDEQWEALEPAREVDEADIDTPTRPRTISAMRAVAGSPLSTRTSSPRRQKSVSRTSTEPMTPIAASTVASPRIPEPAPPPPPTVASRAAAPGSVDAESDSAPTTSVRRRSRALAIGAATLVLVTLFGAGSLVLALQSTPEDPVSTSVAITSETSVSPTTPDPPAGAIVCSEGIARNETTSCEFATNVAEQVHQAGDLQSFKISAYSPVTEQTYTMSCERDTWTRCIGGRNAVVYVLV